MKTFDKQTDSEPSKKDKKLPQRLPGLNPDLYKPLLQHQYHPYENTGEYKHPAFENAHLPIIQPAVSPPTEDSLKIKPVEDPHAPDVLIY